MPLSRGLTLPRSTVPSALNCFGIPLGTPVLSQLQIGLNAGISSTLAMTGVVVATTGSTVSTFSSNPPMIGVNMSARAANAPATFLYSGLILSAEALRNDCAGHATSKVVMDVGPL